MNIYRPVVYLQHGLLCSSADWVIAIPEKSLGTNLFFLKKSAPAPFELSPFF